VAYWNARGGAPKSTYQSLEQKRLALVATQEKLSAEVAALNAEVRTLNQEVSDYNADAGDTFEQGAYHRDRFKQYIHVYEFANETQLVRLVAHEFGHALGLEHGTDEDSIMHPLNTSTSLALSVEDRAALQKLCGLK
jgi:Zn-dependent peptidase ImmA (M78 family)